MESIRKEPYEERLRSLELPSLYYRQCRGNMICAYKLFHGGIDTDPQSFFTLAESYTRGHPSKIQKCLAVSRVQKSSFAIRVVNDWNSLPTEVVCAPSVNAFMARQNVHWAHIRYNIPETD